MDSLEYADISDKHIIPMFMAVCFSKKVGTAFKSIRRYKPEVQHLISPTM